MTKEGTSLLKYSNPSQVTESKGRKVQEKKTTNETEDILNSILPPKRWTKNGQEWIQHVSSTPATRLDVVNLLEDLERALQEQRARETGICPIREELYAQCFDELVRQVTINCAERGLLLLKIRDEIRSSMTSYQTLYESSIAFGMRKTLMTEQRKAELTARIASLKEENQEYDAKISELKEKSENMIRDSEQRNQEEEAAHESSIQQLLDANDSTKKKLETLLAAPKR